MRPSRPALAAGALALLVARAAAQPGATRSATTGFVDPTVATYNGSRPMQCTASSTPTTTFAEQNRATLQFAIGDASATGKILYLPRCSVDALSGSACPSDDSCGYSIGRYGVGGVPASNCGADASGKSNWTLLGYGAVLRGITSSSGSYDYSILCLRGLAHVRILGVHFSMRDNHSTSEQTHWVKIGDNGIGGGSVDDVEIADGLFEEGFPADPVHHGDCLNISGAPGLETTRLSIVNNAFHECNRSGLAHQKGRRFENVVGNTFVGTRNSDVDNEPTGVGDNKYESVIGNTFERTTLGSSAISVSGFSGTGNDLYPQVGMIVADNTVVGGRIEGAGTQQTVVMGNSVTIDWASSDEAMHFTSPMENFWVVGNHIHRGPAATFAQDAITVVNSGNAIVAAPDAPLGYPSGTWVVGNKIENSPTTPTNSGGVGLRMRFNNPFWVVGNEFVYGGSGNSTTTNGYSAIYDEMTTSDSTRWMSGWVAENSMRTTGGQPLAFFYQQLQTQNPAKLGALWVRDNRADGARSLADGTDSFPPTTYPDGGAPIVSGNVLVGTAKTVNNDLKPRRAAQPQSESISSGALSVPLPYSVLTADAAYTLGACVRDGAVKRVKVSAATTGGSVTPTGLGDGTSISWTTAPASFDLACDLGAGKWWVMDRSNVTINP